LSKPDVFDRPPLTETEKAALLAKRGEKPEVGECFNRCAQVAYKLKFPGYNLSVERTPDTVFVFVTYNEPDVFTNVYELQRGRRWIIENNWNEAQIVQTFFKAILTSLEHRAREHFTYGGRAILNPHHSIDQLYELAEGQDREDHPDTKISFS
jgi:hypothetical protein